jgi:hypothetical protein
MAEFPVSNVEAMASAMALGALIARTIAPTIIHNDFRIFTNTSRQRLIEDGPKRLGFVCGGWWPT